MSAPTTEQLRGAIAYLELPRLERYARAHDCFDGLARNDDIAINVLCEHAKASVAAADLEAAKEDRVERGMLESPCDGCGEEIPEDSEYASDHESDLQWCVKCKLELIAAHAAEGATLEPLSLEWCEHFGRRVDSDDDLYEHEHLVEISAHKASTNELVESHRFAVPEALLDERVMLAKAKHSDRVEIVIDATEDAADAA